MKLEVRALVPLKKRCDYCQRDHPPIHECRFPYVKEKGGHSKISQWVDLCADCIEHFRTDARPFAGVDTFSGGPSIQEMPPGPEAALLPSQRAQPRSSQ